MTNKRWVARSSYLNIRIDDKWLNLIDTW